MINGQESVFREKHAAIAFRVNPDFQPGDCLRGADALRRVTWMPGSTRSSKKRGGRLACRLGSRALSRPPGPRTADADLFGSALMLQRLEGTSLVRRAGHVVRVTGLIIESHGPNVSMGDVCSIHTGPGEAPLYAEVVGFRDPSVLLMPLSEMRQLRPRQRSHSFQLRLGRPRRPGVSRPRDRWPRPADGWPRAAHHHAPPLAPCGAAESLTRRRISVPFSTGVRAIDAFMPTGEGQRVGIFAGSGVGKSTLLGMMARSASSEVNVIALVGERGRELREFIERDLGPEGLQRSVLVCATSDQPAPVRLRAALLATAIAEEFRDRGQSVLFMMDSVTRFAHGPARDRSRGSAKAPSSRGYTPSVFAMLPQLLERTGAGVEGAITAFYTVLVEGGDLNVEPIADATRGILDSQHRPQPRALATANHFPAIDVLESVTPTHARSQLAGQS